MNGSHHELPRLYNVRIFRTNIEYLEKFYPEINIDDVLAFTGVTRSEIDDDGYWCTQEQVDRYHKKIVHLTKNPNITRETGRYVLSSRAYSTLRQFIFGFISPSMAYSLLPKIHAKVSKGATIKVNNLGPSKVEVIAKPAPNVSEKPYQCLNRLGQFEALSAILAGNYATVEHPQCFHQGDDECQYIISWVEPLFLKIRRWRNYFLLYGIIMCLILSFFLSLPDDLLLLFAFLLLIISLTNVAIQFESKVYKMQVSDQARTAERLMHESNIRRNEAILVQEIGQAISSIQHIDTFLSTIMSTIEHRLEFDRGMVLLANNEKTRLIYKAGFGFTQEQEDIFIQNYLHLDRPESKGPFVMAFRSKKPYFVEDISKVADELSERSQGLLQLSGTNSFICVPIIFEGEPLGVLSVDRANTSSPLKQSDLDTLMGIAPQIAISLNNARIYEMLQESKQEYHNLVEGANSIILRLDTRGIITFANKYAMDFYGYSRSEMIGRNVAGLIVPEKDNKGRDFHVQMEKYLKNPERYITLEAEHLLKDGKSVWVSWSNKAIRNKDGYITEILSVGNDITSRKQAEEEKRQLEDQLVRAQKMEAIGALAGGVAHDLNNILSGITSYPELLLMEIPEGSPMRKAVLTIKKSGDKAAAIVQDLLTLARRGVNISNVVDLNTIARDYFESPEFSKLQEYHPHTNFEIRLEDELKYILGSEIHLGKTLMNLVSNAAEAMSNGGTVTVSTGNKYLEKPLKGYDMVSQGEYVVLTVADTGIGISEDDLKKIFEPFFSKKTMGRSGTGLGMTVVWSTVKDHKGYIDVESEEGRGTRFNLYFPVTRHILKEKNAKGSIQDYSGTEHILVVDDAEQQRDITKNVLMKLGYKVDIAMSGEDAVEFIKLYAVDLVILDMIMNPGIDGLETYKRMLAVRGLQKAIVVSGFSETDSVREALKLGVGAYIRKPYALSDLAKAVRSELDKTKDTLPCPPVSIP